MQIKNPYTFPLKNVFLCMSDLLEKLGMPATSWFLLRPEKKRSQHDPKPKLREKKKDFIFSKVMDVESK